MENPPLGPVSATGATGGAGWDRLIRALLDDAFPMGSLKSRPLEIMSLAGDGSDRKFFRLRCGRESFVALFSERKKSTGVDENDSYLWIGRHLANRGIPVPRFIFADASDGRFLMEDLGDLHLQGFAGRPTACPEVIYGKALRLLVHLHSEAAAGFDPSFCFDTPAYDSGFIYERELEYFRRAFLNGYLKLDIQEGELSSDFVRLAESGASSPVSSIFHRDFQSRNIMVRGGRLRLIDFQGMRFGPPVYDLASLLVDPYVMLPNGLQRKMEALYRSSRAGAVYKTYNEFWWSYSQVRLCRNLQILGAYGFLGLTKGKRTFLKYIPPAWRHLREWINGPCRGEYPILQDLVNSVKVDAAPNPRDPGTAR